MKYEYKILSIKKRDDNDWYNHSLDLIKNLNLAGYDGWRLVAVSDGIAYFEREVKIEQSEKIDAVLGW